MRTNLLLISLFLVCGSMPGAYAADPCTGFKWDIAKERALFGGPAAAVTAGRSISSAPEVKTNRLYQLTLAPQADVVFASKPGKAAKFEPAYAGLASLRLPAPGNYRIAVDVPFWIDVVADGKLANVTDFQGQHDCDAPHKIVEFELRDARQFVLQLSGSEKSIVRLTVTPATASTP